MFPYRNKSNAKQSLKNYSSRSILLRTCALVKSKEEKKKGGKKKKRNYLLRPSQLHLLAISDRSSVDPPVETFLLSSSPRFFVRHSHRQRPNTRFSNYIGFEDERFPCSLTLVNSAREYGREEKDRASWENRPMFTVNFSWTSESVGRLSFRRREGRVDREGQARVCTRSKKARVRSRGFKLTGPDRMRALLFVVATFRTPARKIRTRSSGKRFLQILLHVQLHEQLSWKHRSKIFEPELGSDFFFLLISFEIVTIIANSNLGRKDFIFLIFFFFFCSRRTCR